MRMRLPETMDSVTKIPMDAKTAPDTCIGGPKWFVHSSRFVALPVVVALVTYEALLSV